MTTSSHRDTPHRDPLPSDQDLVKQAHRGNHEAFAQIVSRYFHMVYVVAYGYLKDHESAEDLAQETFIRAYASLATMRDGQYLPAWLNQITRNHALNWLKQGTRRSRVITMMQHDNNQSIPDQTPSARDTVIAREHQYEIDKAVLALPDDMRTTILLHYSEDLSKSEIARRLGVHPSSIGRQLDKAHALLRSKLGAETTQPNATLSRKPESVAKAVALLAAFSALTSTSQAAVLQGAGNAAATPLPPSEFAAKLQIAYSSLSLTVWLAVALVTSVAFTGTGVMMWPRSEISNEIPSIHHSKSRLLSTPTSSPNGQIARLGTTSQTKLAPPQILGVDPAEKSLIHGRVTRPDGIPAGNAQVAYFIAQREIVTTVTNAVGEYELIVPE